MRSSILWFSAGLLLLAASGCVGAQARPNAASNSAAVDLDPTHTLARRVLAQRDHAGLPFAIVDKRSATLTIFHRDGRPAGATPVLLGQLPGDLALPGVGERAQRAELRPADHTTPAGRYSAEPGRNLDGEAIVWLDYEKALAIHRLRPGPAQQRRAQRLASPDPRERRISAGCVVVPVAFYEAVVAPVLGRSRAIVYVMAEDVPTLEQEL
jgi:hypothetical protein